MTYPNKYIVDVIAVLGCVFSLSACHSPALLSPAAFPFLFFPPPAAAGSAP